MPVFPTAIADVFVIEPAVFADARGYFLESYNRRTFASIGLAVDFVQDNLSFSRRGTLRGLHFQRSPHAQAKLVRVVSGRILDVALDLRAGSPTFGQSVVTELSGDNHRALFIPRGFAHGFLALTDAYVAYKADAFYAPQSEGAVNALDPELSIDWPLPLEKLLRSPKDEKAASWTAYRAAPSFAYEGAPA